jgi:hypothetical protein
MEHAMPADGAEEDRAREPLSEELDAGIDLRHVDQTTRT